MKDPLQIILLTQLFQQPGQGQVLSEKKITFMDMTNRLCLRLRGETRSNRYLNIEFRV